MGTSSFVNHYRWGHLDDFQLVQFMTSKFEHDWKFQRLYVKLFLTFDAA